MKTRFLSLLCTALFAAGILLGAATASAHGMTYWEATLVLDDTATGGQNRLEPRKATLGRVVGGQRPTDFSPASLA